MHTYRINQNDKPHHIAGGQLGMWKSSDSVEHCQTSNVFCRFIFWFDHKTFSCLDFGFGIS